METKKAVYSVLHSGSELGVCGHGDDADHHHDRLHYNAHTELKETLSVHENLALEFTNFLVDFDSMFLSISQLSFVICQY